MIYEEKVSINKKKLFGNIKKNYSFLILFLIGTINYFFIRIKKIIKKINYSWM